MPLCVLCLPFLHTSPAFCHKSPCLSFAPRPPSLPLLSFAISSYTASPVPKPIFKPFKPLLPPLHPLQSPHASMVISSLPTDAWALLCDLPFYPPFCPCSSQHLLCAKNPFDGTDCSNSSHSSAELQQLHSPSGESKLNTSLAAHTLAARLLCRQSVCDMSLS